jgi:hypothetical protein
MTYDENLPKYFNQNHRFLWNRMDKQELEKTKLFEKSEIQWFSVKDMKKHRIKAIDGKKIHLIYIAN